MNIDPITILLFLLFFVAPLVNNFLRRGQGGSKGSQRETQRGAGRGRGDSQRPQRPNQRAQESEERGDTTADTSRDTSSGGAGDEFTKRLEDARRRVQEAMSGESRSAQAPKTTQTERSGDLFQEEDPARRQQGQSQQPSRQGQSQQGRSRQGQSQQGTRRPFEGLGREGVGQASSRPASQQGTMTKQTSAERTELGDAPPLRVQRLRGRKSAKMDKRGILEFDRRSVTQGIIWREILNEPLSKRKRKQRP